MERPRTGVKEEERATRAKALFFVLARRRVGLLPFSQKPIPARMSATRVAQEFSPGSAKWIRLRGCIEWVTETPFTADVSICFPLPAFSPLPSFLFPASVQYTMVAVIRCNGGEWVGGVSLRVAGTGRYRSEGERLA